MFDNKQEFINQERIQIVKRLLSETRTLPVTLENQKFDVEYLTVPAANKEGDEKPPIFVYPGGGTHLAPCFEHLLYLNRAIIVISPLGYGKSSDMPFSLLKKDPLFGAKVALAVLQSLGINRVEIFTHSNAAPIAMKMSLIAHNYAITVQGITMANPLGLRRIWQIFPMIAFPISGLLSKIASWGYQHPYVFLKEAYQCPKRPLSVQKIYKDVCNILYELDKSSKPRLTELLHEAKDKGFRVRIALVQSSWDWASFHYPWTMSNEQIFRENLPNTLFDLRRISGLHNSTLGRQSRLLAKAMGVFICNISLAYILLPHLPALINIYGLL